MISEQEREVEIPGISDRLSDTVEKTTKEILAHICQELKRKYKRDFIVSQIISDPGVSRVKMIVQSLDEPVICFPVWMDSTERIQENYVRFLCMHDLKKSLENSFRGISACAYLLEDESVGEEDTGLTLQAYLQKHNVRRVLVHMLIQENIKPDQSRLLELIEKASRFFGTDIAAYCYMLEKDDYDRCSKYFDTLPFVSEAIIHSFSPVSSLTIFAAEGAARLREVK